jgi:hypothetical protein
MQVVVSANELESSSIRSYDSEFRSLISATIAARKRHDGKAVMYYMERLQGIIAVWCSETVRIVSDEPQKMAKAS